MKFGKLEHIEGVDFTLPLFDSQSQQILGGVPADDFQVFVGLPRWASKSWVGDIYPPKTKPAQYLKFYAKTFNTIEFNSTHYRSPSIDQVLKWREQVEFGFVFCPKIPQVISHYRKLLNCQPEVTAFLDSIAHFEEYLGCMFLQLPESFSPKMWENLAQFVSQWPTGFPLALEFRHPDWFVDQALIPEVRNLLTQFHISTVISDVAGRRDVSHQSLTTKTAMIRFVGNGLHKSDYRRFEKWLDAFADWKARGLERLYVFPHQPDDVWTSSFGKYVRHALAEKLDVKFDPLQVIPDSGDQLKLF
ncbi:DUF72 domain-containing protein [Pontibacter sp. G13]|uniref:DUF72 domain-containing protein n=1 Tax=Pontibacter sp. G13 TaxID=3074898 RepID=UPI00288B2116|nr:DUF72 domain-containing protein [Pontibacter sp. G13]WNJ21251.1 DUF72 domain-containing protein [Pontibacter sp. G13]